MPGSQNNPVVLDPFQTIVEVAWSAFDLAILSVEHIDSFGPDFNPVAQGITYKTPSYFGRIRLINSPTKVALTRMGSPESSPPNLDWEFNETAAIGNNTTTVRPSARYPGGFTFNTAIAKNSTLSLRSDPPATSFGDFNNQCPENDDLRLPGSAKAFFDNYYLWYCGAPNTSPSYATYLFNARLLRQDWAKGDGLKVGDLSLRNFPIPEGGESDPLDFVQVRFQGTHELHGAYRRINIRTYRGVSGVFTQQPNGFVSYKTNSADPDAQKVTMVEDFSRAYLDNSGIEDNAANSTGWDFEFDFDGIKATTLIKGATLPGSQSTPPQTLQAAQAFGE